MRAWTGSPAPDFAFQGEQRDQTGLYYLRARYYDPGTGRFLTRDPIGLAGGQTNLCAYVGNNPVHLSGADTRVRPHVAG